MGLPDNSFNIYRMVHHVQKKDDAEEHYIVLLKEYPSGMKEKLKMYELIKNAPVGRTDYNQLPLTTAKGTAIPPMPLL